MSEEEAKPTIEIVHLPTGGSIPGIPGTHAPGRYIIDWIKRTLTPVVDIVESEIARVEETIEHKAASGPVPMQQPETFAPSDTVLNAPAIETGGAN